ncbi:hypothetical protein, conserved [Eimeria tenella]|uniref:Uncharacterized protein n=1 Tax=Eimeria tenella TaxID=5802 RepID=U6KLR5_EIMTE|nr:hypothetical protein, conserved [Eimeria tenella]CDJ39042.1 hypothetical protein, conserved [Eimeria tenella]|eukprot:XP_013229797.1 hypothetical protein, conserved [Eimeria tenella]
MDKEEVEDLIKKCFEADNNGEINFLSFWAGMENLLELLGIREPTTHIDDKVYGLQVFRDGLLAEAMRKQQGPTSSVLLSRDEVLQIIDQTNKSVTFRHNERQMEDRRCGSLQAREACPSSLFWDEVHRETSLLEPTSVLSITELSMMVFGFLKSYLQEKSTAIRLPDGDSQDAGQPATPPDSGRIVPSTLSRASSATSEFHCVPVWASPNIGSAGATYEKDAKDQKLRSGNSAASSLACDGLDENYGDESQRGQWRGSPRMEHALSEQQERPVSGSSASSTACPAGPRHDGGSEHRSFEESSRSARDDILALLKTVESEDPFVQLRELLIFAGRSTESGMLSKKEVQHLRYLNAAAIDCMDRIAAERDKRNDEMNDAVLSLRRMRTEKQQLVERLEGFEHEHSQLRMQQEQHLCDQEKLHQLQAALSSGQMERERIEALLHDKEENLLCVTREKDALIDKLTLQSEHLNRLLAVAQKEKADAAEELRQTKETLTREKETLEGQLRFAEDRARAAEAARQQLQGDISAGTSTLRQRILELEEDKQRQEAEAEENDALIQQLQGRLEEKVQQVTILEVKNKQQARLLQQVRGVRNCLMQILQESRQEEPVKDASYANEVGTAQRDHELMKLKAGMKAALAHIKDLEAFTDEMRKQHRRGVHPRYELAATAGESSARSLQKRQVDHLVGASWRALPTLGDELEMSQAPSASDSSRDGSGSGIQKQPSRPTEGRQVSEKSAFSFPRGNEFTKENTSEEPETSKRRQSESAATNINEMDLKAPLIEAVATSEQSATGAKQIAYSSGVVNADIPAVRRPRDSHPGASVSDTELLFVRWGAEYPYAAVRSEPSTTDGVSKEPTSSASLPEAEDIFDPLDLLRFEDSVKEEGEEEYVHN